MVGGFLRGCFIGGGDSAVTRVGAVILNGGTSDSLCIVYVWGLVRV